ncbi:MAG: DUF177 domain-containing protein [Phycisphaerae bacterium]|nr:DUF177 domain-containing protein [Phycisphaerae bacterium]NIX30169.1 hypothetical protein [Phycisphaerae bacterium]
MITKQRFERKGKRAEKGRKGNPLQFNVAQFLKQPGPDARHYIIEQATLAALSNEFTMPKPLNGQVKFVKTGKNILVTGTFETELILPCTRCLTDTRVSISFEIEETFIPTVDIVTGTKLTPSPEADEATFITEQHILDLTEVIRQEIYISTPTQVLCQPDCLGLCPHCGANRNLEPCYCEADQIDIRWADLLALKDDFS